MSKEQAFAAWWANRQNETHPDGNPSTRWCAAFKPDAKAAFFAAWEAATKSARDACAKKCEELEDDMGYGKAQKCADAIRAPAGTKG